MPTATTLTQKQQRFVSEYLVDGEGKRAAIAAGYGPVGAAVTAHRLIHANRAVRAEIQARQAQDSQRMQISRETAIQGLLEAIAEARAQATPAAMIAGWKAIAQMLGLMAPVKHQVDVASAADRAAMGKLERLSDAELLALMAGGGEAAG